MSSLASPAATHPIFTPTTITSSTTLLETDYNLHKSNSTYFADLDVSRTALVTKLYIKGAGVLRKKLEEEEGKKGRMNVILGSVFTSFKREILPYQTYEICSKIAGWDNKWLYVITFFQKPAKKGGKQDHSSRLLAMSISKYVVKKGRWTVAPEAILTASGLLPDKPASAPAIATATLSSGVATPSATETDGLTAATVTGAESSILEAGESIVLVASDEAENAAAETAAGDEHSKQSPSTQAARAGLEWSWARVDEERKRGLEIVKGYIDVDGGLAAEFERLA